MAYKLRYYKEINQGGIRYRLEIHKKDSTLPAIEIGKVLQGLSLDIQGQQDDIDAPIVKTSLSMTFVDAYDLENGKKNGMWEEFYTPDSLEWKVQLLEADDGVWEVFWTGYVTPDSYSENLTYRGSVNIVARDNIGHLQDFPFDAEGDADGMISLRQLVYSAFNKCVAMAVYFEPNARWMQTEGGTYAPSTLMNVSAFEGMNWYEALEAALYAYGAVLRYNDWNIFRVIPLRWLPQQTSYKIAPVFEAGATRELVPAVKMIEETAEYELESSMSLPKLVEDDYTGSGIYQCELPVVNQKNEVVQNYTSEAPVNPIANVQGNGWGNISNSTLFFDISRYDVGYFSKVRGLEDEIKRYMYIAANNKENRLVYYTLTAPCVDMAFRLKLGTPIGLDSSSKVEQLVVHNLWKITYAITKEQNGVEEYYQGDGRWSASYKELTMDFNATQPTNEVEFLVEMGEATGSAKFKFGLIYIGYAKTSSGGLSRKGVYACVQDFSVGVLGSVSLRSKNRVNTLYSDTNNVVLERNVGFAPAFDFVPFPAIIKNGIFEREGDVVTPAKNWLLHIADDQQDEKVQMAVGIHMALLTFYAKPNNLVTGTIISPVLRRRAIFQWQGKDHLMISGSFNFLTGKIEGAVLREFALFDHLWSGASVGGGATPETQQTSSSNQEQGGSASSQPTTYEATEKVTASGGSGAWFLDDLKDVSTSGAGNSNILIYDSTNAIWKAAKPAAILSDVYDDVAIIREEFAAADSALYEDLDFVQSQVESLDILVDDLLESKIDRENDDYYPQMAVGLADNLAGVDVVESDFTFRRSGGGAISDGVARIEAIKGNSVVEDGEVIHMNVQSLKSVGRNAWDEKWRVGAYVSTTGAYYAGSINKLCNLNPIAVLPNSQYYVDNDIVNEVYFYDEKMNFISTEYFQYLKKFTTPANARYVNFNTANLSKVEYNNDICINLFDSSFNGKYEPYIERSEDLSIVRTYFPQGMKSAGTAHDEIRYNKATQKWEKVEAVGTRAYQKGDAENAEYLTDGKVTCYPLAEPVVTELDAEDQFKDLDYQVWNGGTEEAISEGKSAPLSADITYGFNAVGKIKELESIIAQLRAKLGI